MKQLVIGMTLAVLATGCSTDWIHRMMREDAAELTDFLPGKERLVRQPDTFPVHYTWADDNAIEKADFKSVYVAPIDLSYLRKGNGYDEWRNKVVGLDDAINELGDYGRRAFVKAFESRKIKVVDDPKASHAAVFELAITAFVPTRSEIAVVGTAVDFVVPGIGLVADCLSSGMIAVECRIRDSATQEVVMMFADTEGDPNAVLSLSKFTYTSSAKINLKKLAQVFVESCFVADVSKMRRDFPFSFVSGPWESKLDD